MHYLKSLRFILLFFLSQTLYASEIANENQKTLLLPINEANNIKTSLQVNIPENFRPLQTQDEGMKKKLFEFVPKADNQNKWTQIITLNMFIGIKKSARDFNNLMKVEFKKTPNAKLLEDSVSQQDNYMISTLGFSYEDNERNEVVYMRYYSGTDDLCGIQYAKPLKKNQTPDDLLKELKTDLDKISTVIVDKKD